MNIKRKSMRAAMLSVGLAAVLCAGTGVSFAQTSGSEGVGSGNQVAVPVTAPIDACGNAVAVIGRSLATCQGGATATDGDQDALEGADTSGYHGVLSGNQLGVPVTAPVDACGNTAAVVGGALAYCQGGASTSGDQDDALEGADTTGRHGVLSGNQLGVPVTAPVNVCGNTAAVVGGALAYCQGGASTSDDDDVVGPLAADQSGTATRTEGNGTSLPIVGLLPQLPTLPIIGG